jgi:hypothetical protein
VEATIASFLYRPSLHTLDREGPGARLCLKAYIHKVYMHNIANSEAIAHGIKTAQEKEGTYNEG